MSEKAITLYAAGSAIIVDFEELCLKNDIRIDAIINNHSEKSCQATLTEKVVPVSQYQCSPNSAPFMCPLFSPHNRYKAVNEALQKGLEPFDLLSDANNDLPVSLVHGVGCFINKRVVIGAQSRLGNYVFINRGAALGHHLFLEDFVSIGPGVVTGGNVHISKGAMIGTGAIILPERTIGKHAIVGAGAVVTRNIEDYSIVTGNPARVIKQNRNDF